MESKVSEPKKAILIRLLQILENRTDENHPLKQAEIIDIMEKEYGLVCERKAITRNVEVLRELGYEIESSRRGCYLLSRKFENSELRLLIDSVLGSRYINSRHSKDLIEKLAEFGGANFRTHAKHIYTQKIVEGKNTNADLFYNVEVLDEAIEKHLKVEFYFNKYGVDKRLHKSSDDRRVVNPYQLIVHNQRYYLAGNVEGYDNLAFFRVERISDIRLTDTTYKPVTQLKGYEQGVDWGDIVTKLPYLYPDKPEQITLICERSTVDTLVDWFGFDFTVTEVEGDKIRVKLFASPKAMLYWLVQYGTSVKVLEPEHLRSEVIEKILKINEKYGIKVEK